MSDNEKLPAMLVVTFAVIAVLAIAAGAAIVLCNDDTAHGYSECAVSDMGYADGMHVYDIYTYKNGNISLRCHTALVVGYDEGGNPFGAPGHQRHVDGMRHYTVYVPDCEYITQAIVHY